MKEKKCECGCGTGDIIGSQGGCGICSPVVFPKTFQTGYDKFGKTSEELIERYSRLSMNIAGHYDISLPLEVFDFISKEIDKAYQKGKEEGIVEHCDEPNCPECNLVAYNKGRSQILEEIKSHFHELKSKIDNAFYEMSKEIE